MPEYKIKEPPSPMLRVLGPVLGTLTIAVLASGVFLVVGPHWAHGAALFVHKKIFYPWLGALALRYGRFVRLDATKLQIGRYLFDRYGDKVVDSRPQCRTARAAPPVPHRPCRTARSAG